MLQSQQTKVTLENQGSICKTVRTTLLFKNYINCKELGRGAEKADHRTLSKASTGALSHQAKV